MSILDWPTLKSLDVYGCPMLKIFATDSLSSPESYPEEDEDLFTSGKRGIVSAQKVSLNLERLSLGKETVTMIEQGIVPHVDLLLQNIKFLTLHGFDKDSDAFPHVFVSKVPLPSIQEFAVIDSVFEKTPHYHTKSFSSRPKKFELSSRRKLNSRGFDYTRLAPPGKNPQYLEVLAWSCLTNLALSTVSFSRLTELNVEDCAGLKYLFTSSTARSLVVLRGMSIINCESLETVVVLVDDEKGDKKDEDVVFPELSSLSLKKLPKLGSLFPASFTKDNLQKLDVRNCAETEEIVAKDDETATEETSKKVVVFPKLTSLTIWDLPKLRCICLGMSILDLPMLKSLDVYGCPMLTIFATDSLSSPESYPEDDEDLFTFGKHDIVSAQKVPPNLERLSLNKENVIIIEQGLVSHVDLLLQNIKVLTLQGFDKDSDAFPHVFFSKVPLPSIQEFAVVDSDFKKIVLLEIIPHYTTKSFSSRPEKLNLRSQRKLKSIGFQHTSMAPLVENPQHLEVLAWSCLTNLALSGVSFSRLTELNVEDCAGLKYLFTSSTARSLVVLSEMSIINCESLETVIAVADDQEGDNPDDVVFPELSSLSLKTLPKLGSLFPTSFAKDNLQKLDVRNCAETKEIVAKDDETATEEASKKVVVFPKVTSLTLWDLPKLRCICLGMSILDWPMLKSLDVYGCPMLKIFAADSLRSRGSYPEEDEGLCTSGKHGIVSAQKVPPNLERLSLNKENVIMIEQGLFPHVNLLLQNIKFLTLHGFDKDSDAFPHVFFSKVPLPSIQEFVVVDIAFKKTPHYTTKSPFPWPKILDLSSSPKLNSRGTFKNTPRVAPLVKNPQYLEVLAWSCLTNLALSIVSFSRLTKLNVKDCSGLKYLFTSSTARSLVVLSEMSIINCESLETVVALVDDETATEEVSKRVAVFPKVTLLTLWDLPKLRCICSGMDILDWPVLQDLDVYHCQMLKMFAIDFHNSPDLSPEGQDHLRTDKHGIISANKVPPNLERLSLNKEDVTLTELGLVPHVDIQLQKIKFLRMQGFNNDSHVFLPEVFFSKVSLPSMQEFGVADSAFKEIFPSQMPGMDFYTKSFSQVEKLELRSLYRLESIGFEHTWVAPFVENLQDLKVLACNCLTNLAPSTVSFSRLTELNVEDCAGLKYLFTSSTAKRLVELEKMSITNCESLETVVVANDEEGDKKGEDVVFPELFSLSLTKLPKLGSFYTGNSTLNFSNSDFSFSVKITQCKSMKTFSHGDVEVDELDELEIDGAKWDDVDLNSAVRQQFEKATKQP